MIVFVVSGLWHGANWTYVIWGALHGLYLVLQETWDRIAPPWARLPRFCAQALTLLAVILAGCPSARRIRRHRSACSMAWPG